MTHEVRFRPEAEADLFTLYRYISDRSGPVRAGDYIARIEAACMALATFPQRGTKRDDLAPGIRIIGFERRATIAFRVEDDTVRIVRIFYGGRDYETYFHGLEEDDWLSKQQARRAEQNRSRPTPPGRRRPPAAPHITRDTVSSPGRSALAASMACSEPSTTTRPLAATCAMASPKLRMSAVVVDRISSRMR
jgi:toxin ParE1/3/4